MKISWLSVFVFGVLMSFTPSCGPVKASCDKKSCAWGCCDAAGVCQAGTTSSACGSAAATCTACSLGAICSLGTCTSSGSGGGSVASGGGVSSGGGSSAGGGTASGGGSSVGGGSNSGGGSAGGGSGAGNACDASNCDGCCRPDGMCNDGTSSAACGEKGATCQSCALPQTCNQTTPGLIGGSCARRYKIFITSLGYAGNFGGLAMGDAKCALHASAGNLSGTFKAWLATSSSTALSRFPSGGPWFDTNSQKIFNNVVNLQTAPVTTDIADENGNVQRNPIFWVGSIARGFCTDWTVGTNSGQAGIRTLSGWSNSWQYDYCGSVIPLLCLEQ